MQDPYAGASVKQRFIKSITHDDVFGIAAEIAYRFLFAVFPFGLFVAALGSFVASVFHVDNPAAAVLSAVRDNLPASIAEPLQPELEHLLSSARPDLLVAGALGALLAATGGTNALVKGIHRAYDVPEDRPIVMRYAIAFGLTLVAAMGAVASFVSIVGGALVTQSVADRFGLGPQASALLGVVQWPIAFAVLTGAVAVLYRYAPNVVAPWRWIVAGSASFALAWLVATTLLRVYIGGFGNYGATYGSLGAVIVLMIWFYLTGTFLMMGAEVASALAWKHSPEAIHRRHEELEAVAAVERASNTVKEAAASVAGATDEGPGDVSRPARAERLRRRDDLARPGA